MRCEVCQGSGLRLNAPCAECGGFGIIHCCEGLVASPECGPDESKIRSAKAAIAIRMPTAAAKKSPRSILERF